MDDALIDKNIIDKHASFNTQGSWSVLFCSSLF